MRIDVSVPGIRKERGKLPAPTLTGCEVFAPAVRSYPGVKCVTVADLLGGPRGPQRASPTSIRERGQETWGFLWYKAGRGWWFDAAARAPDHHRG